MAWSVAQKKFCCAFAGKACGKHACDQGEQQAWTAEKKLWCCKKNHVACKLAYPYDCLFEEHKWDSWPQAKKDYCCKREGRCAADGAVKVKIIEVDADVQVKAALLPLAAAPAPPSSVNAILVVGGLFAVMGFATSFKRRWAAPAPAKFAQLDGGVAGVVPGEALSTCTE